MPPSFTKLDKHLSDYIAEIRPESNSNRQLLKYMNKHDDEWEHQFYKNLNSRLLTFLDNHEKKWADMK